MTNNEINNYLIKIKAEPKQRIERDNGGQYLDNFLFEFAKIVRDNTIDKCRGSLKKLKSEYDIFIEIYKILNKYFTKPT